MISIPKIQIVEAPKPSSMMNMVSDRRYLNHLAKQTSAIASSYVGLPNNEQTMRDLEAQLQKYFDNVSIPAYVVNADGQSQEDKLIASCNSYEEYKMKSAIISADSKILSEDAFQKRHDDALKGMKIQVSIQTNPIHYQTAEINLSLDGESKDQKGKISL